MNNEDWASSIYLKLPKEKGFKKYGSFKNMSSDNYGALEIASHYSGYNLPDKSFDAIWFHGVFGPWNLISPKFILNNVNYNKNFPILASREDEKNLLQSFGYKNVHAIGLPINYIEEPKLERKHGSLLIMPAHSLDGYKIERRDAIDRYVKDCISLAKNFSSVGVCIHKSCIKNNIWVEEFKNAGFVIYPGAHIYDANSLNRIYYLLNSFDYVTSNEFGSHVAYALSYGCKVSIWGDTLDYEQENIAKDDFYKHADPEMLMTIKSKSYADNKKRFLEKFFVEPKNGIRDTELGKNLIGKGNIVDPAKMKDLLKLGFRDSLGERLIDNGKKVGRRLKKIFFLGFDKK